MAEALKCGSKIIWIGLTIGCLVTAFMYVAPRYHQSDLLAFVRLFIVAGAVGGCSCAGSCDIDCTEIFGGMCTAITSSLRGQLRHYTDCTESLSGV